MKKKLLAICITATMLLSLTACGNSGEVDKSTDEKSTPVTETTSEKPKQTEPNKPVEEKIYTNGEAWVVDGQFSVTFTAVTQTDERNEFADKTPTQVVILNYDYENIGLTDDLYVSNFKIMDVNGEMADTYPANITTHPQATPTGGKCVGAQDAYGLNNVSDKITVIAEIYDDSFTAHKAKFELTIQ